MTDQRCPRCGTPVPADDRFVEWCDQCDWNADPDPPRPPATGYERLLDRLGQRTGDSLFETIRSERDLRPRWDLPRIATYGFALFVHAAVLVVFAGGVALIVLPRSFIAAFVGLCLIVLAIDLRPRFGRLPKTGIAVERVDAPHLYALLDAIAEHLHAHPVATVRIDGDFNASFSRVGIPRKSVVTIGALLWPVLDPQERAATLGHELAHDVNGDSTYGLIVGSAERTLMRTYNHLIPEGVNRVAAIDLMMRAMQWAGRWIINGVLAVQLRLNFRAQQRAEYLADELAAEVASTDAMVGALDKLALGDGCRLAIQIAREGRQAYSTLDVAAKYGHEISERERERLRRRAIARRHQIDASHPPTGYRIDGLRARQARPGVVELTAAESEAIDGELRAARKRRQPAASPKAVVLPGLEHRPTEIDGSGR